LTPYKKILRSITTFATPFWEIPTSNCIKYYNYSKLKAKNYSYLTVDDSYQDIAQGLKADTILEFTEILSAEIYALSLKKTT
jgi:hypothetical protein